MLKTAPWQAAFLISRSFFPKDIYLGVLMSTVCGVHVGGWAGVGACSAEGGGAGERLGVD